MSKNLKIGFPPPLLGDAPLRLDVLAHKQNSFLIFDKPAGMLFEADSFNLSTSNIIGAMKTQAGKPEFERLGITSPYAVHQMDFEQSGACVVAMNKDSAAVLRNALGSDAFEFEFLFVCKDSTASKENPRFLVDLPILKSQSKERMVPSHRYGKGAKTEFEFLKSANGFEIWRATTKFLRPHQIRLHAAERGLEILGETLYSEVPLPYLSSLKKKFNRTKNFEEKPIYSSLALHLERVKFSAFDESFDTISTLPKNFNYLLECLGLKSS